VYTHLFILQLLTAALSVVFGTLDLQTVDHRDTICPRGLERPKLVARDSSGPPHIPAGRPREGNGGDKREFPRPIRLKMSACPESRENFRGQLEGRRQRFLRLLRSGAEDTGEGAPASANPSQSESISFPNFCCNFLLCLSQWQLLRQLVSNPRMNSQRYWLLRHGRYIWTTRCNILPRQPQNLSKVDLWYCWGKGSIVCIMTTFRYFAGMFSFATVGFLSPLLSLIISLALSLQVHPIPSLSVLGRPSSFNNGCYSCNTFHLLCISRLRWVLSWSVRARPQDGPRGWTRGANYRRDMEPIPRGHQ